MNAYESTSQKDGSLHTRADCYQLANADGVTRTTVTDATARDWCGSCGDGTHTTAPPDRLPCPCGAGHAERTTVPIREPYTLDGSKTATHYHYRHDCGLGGTLVAVDGAAVRRLGPVFEPERYAPVGSGVSASD